MRAFTEKMCVLRAKNWFGNLHEPCVLVCRGHPLTPHLPTWPAPHYRAMSTLHASRTAPESGVGHRRIPVNMALLDGQCGWFTSLTEAIDAPIHSYRSAGSRPPLVTR